MAETHFDEWIAQHYEDLWPELFVPEAIDAPVEVLAQWAGPGPVLELGVGTGRIALPLSRRGLEVQGIELSRPMATRLGQAADSRNVEVTIGDFATTSLDKRFTLAYLIRNTITNLTTQDEQVACFQNAAAHLIPGGSFCVENYIPELQRIPVSQSVHVFVASPTHLAFEDYDTGSQIAVSHHYWMINGQMRTMSSPHRYVWPAELDLMARLAGMTLVERWADWRGTPFNGTSRSHVSIWTKLGD
jgi:SAM-dependent methyltransferase